MVEKSETCVSAVISYVLLYSHCFEWRLGERPLSVKWVDHIKESFFVLKLQWNLFFERGLTPPLKKRLIYCFFLCNNSKFLQKLHLWIQKLFRCDFLCILKPPINIEWKSFPANRWHQLIPSALPSDQLSKEACLLIGKKRRLKYRDATISAARSRFHTRHESVFSYVVLLD